MDINEYSPEKFLSKVKSLFSSKKKQQPAKTVSAEPVKKLNLTLTLNALKKKSLKVDDITLSPTIARITLSNNNRTKFPSSVKEILLKVEDSLKKSSDLIKKIETHTKPLRVAENDLWDHNKPDWTEPSVVLTKLKVIKQLMDKLGDPDRTISTLKQADLLGVDDKGEWIPNDKSLTIQSPNSAELNRITGLSSKLVDLYTTASNVDGTPVIDTSDPPIRAIDPDFDDPIAKAIFTIDGIYNGDEKAEDVSEKIWELAYGVEYMVSDLLKLLDKIVELTALVNEVEPIYEVVK